MLGFYGSNKQSAAVCSSSLQNRIQTETWGTRPAILLKLIGPDTDEKLLHGKHLETLQLYTGIWIKSVCSHSDLFVFLLTPVYVDSQRKCLCAPKKFSTVSFERSLTNISPVFFPPFPGPRVWLHASSLARPPSMTQWCSLSTDVSSCLPCHWSDEGCCHADNGPHLVNSAQGLAGYKTYRFHF